MELKVELAAEELEDSREWRLSRLLLTLRIDEGRRRITSKQLVTHLSQLIHVLWQSNVSACAY